MAAGVFDTSLDGDGWRQDSGPTEYWDAQNAAVVMANNRVVMGGISWDMSAVPRKRYAHLSKYLVDGSMDMSFGQDGKVVFSLGVNDEGTPISGINDLAIDSQQRIVAVGQTVYSDVLGSREMGFVTRFDANGVLDSTFGDGGIVRIDTVGSGGRAMAVAVDSMDRIAVIGDDYSSGWYAWVAQLSANGSTNWFQSVTGGITNAKEVDITIGPGNKVVALGQYYPSPATSGNTDSFVARFGTDGTWDSSFGGTGFVPGDANDSYKGIATDVQGRVVVVGHFPNHAVSGGNDVRVARFTASGIFDNSFDTDGRLSAVFSGHGGWGGGSANSVVVGADGKITIGGKSSDGGQEHVAIMRVLSNGRLDQSFGDAGGWLTPATHSNAQLLIDSQSRIIMAGGQSSDCGFSRYTPTNVIPAFDGLPTQSTYTENASPTILASNGSVLDPDNENYLRGKLTISIASGASVSDQLSITHQGNGPGQIGINGSTVSFEGWTIGTKTGGIGAAPLVINFTTKNATRPAVNALIRAVTFRSTGENPPVQNRVVQFLMNDGSLGTSTAHQITMTVQSINDRPVISNLGSAVEYTENAAPVLVAGSASLVDVDSADLFNGQLIAKLSSGARPEDRLSIVPSGPISISGNQVLYESISIGTFSGGVASTPLTVTLNASSTPAKTQSLLQHIAYSNVSESPNTSTRTLWVQVSDGDGGVSYSRTKSIQVVSVIDNPVLSGIGGTTTPYTMNHASGIALSPNATVTDLDSPTWNNGKLTVEVTSSPDASNRLYFFTTLFTFSGNSIVRNGITIGTISSDGVGLNKLEVTFNSNATTSIVQLLLRSARFKTINSLSNADRVASFVLSDGVGGVSSTQTKTIDVV